MTGLDGVYIVTNARAKHGLTTHVFETRDDAESYAAALGGGLLVGVSYEPVFMEADPNTAELIASAENPFS